MDADTDRVEDPNMYGQLVRNVFYGLPELLNAPLISSLFLFRGLLKIRDDVKREVSRLRCGDGYDRFESVEVERERIHDEDMLYRLASRQQAKVSKSASERIRDQRVVDLLNSMRAN